MNFSTCNAASVCILLLLLDTEVVTCGAAVPWSPSREAAEGQECARYFLGTIDSVVDETGLGWHELIEISIKRVTHLIHFLNLHVSLLHSTLQIISYMQ